MLTSTNAELLTTLSENAGFTTRRISELAKFSYGGTRQQRSAAIRVWLAQLQSVGFVRKLDNEKPAAWKRTANGTQALREYERAGKP